MNNTTDFFIEGKDLESRPVRRISFDDNRTSTIFTDEEAFGICGGIVDKEARAVWKRHQFQKGTVHDSFRAHQIAMMLLKQEGYDKVSMLLALPPMPLGIGNASAAFQIFDDFEKKKKKEGKQPCIRLIDSNKRRYTVEFSLREEIVFKTKIVKSKSRDGKVVKTRIKFQEKVRRYDYNSLVFKTKDGKVGELTRDGKFKPDGESPANRYVVELIKRFLKDPQKEFIFYGTETGQCSNCNRHISDKRSVSIAVGPICAKRLGLRWGV